MTQRAVGRAKRCSATCPRLCTARNRCIMGRGRARGVPIPLEVVFEKHQCVIFKKKCISLYFLIFIIHIFSFVGERFPFFAIYKPIWCETNSLIESIIKLRTPIIGEKTFWCCTFAIIYWLLNYLKTYVWHEPTKTT